MRWRKQMAAPGLAALLSIGSLACATADERGCQEPVLEVCVLLQQSHNSPDRKSALLDEASRLLEQGLSETVDEPKAHAHWLRMQWFYHFLQDEHSASLPFLIKAIELLEAEGSDIDMLVEYTANLGWTYELLGDISLAMSYSRKAAAMSVEHQLGRQGSFYHELGVIHASLGELRIARSYLEAARDIYLDRGDEFGLVMVDGKLGSILRREGSSSEAIRLHTRVLEYFEQRYPYRSLAASIELAWDHNELGNWDLAYEYAHDAWSDPRILEPEKIDAGLAMLTALTRSQPLAHQVGDTVSADDLLGEIGAILSRQDKEARDKTAYPVEKLRFFKVAIDFHADDASTDLVSRYGQEGIALINQVANELRGSGDNFFAWMAMTQPFFNAYVVALKSDDKDLVPWVLDARYDWRERRDIVRSASTIASAIEHEEITMLEHVVAAEKALMVLAANPPTEAEDLSRRLKRQRDLALEAYLGERSLRMVSETTAHSRTVDRAVDQQDIASTDIVLRYFVQEEDSFVIALTRDESHHMQLPSRAELRELIQGTSRAVSSANSTGHDLVALLTQLNSLLPLDFIFDQNRAERIVVIPDGAVHLAPFAAINIAAENEPFNALGVRYEVLRTHSIGGYYGKVPQAERTMEEARPRIAVLANPEVDQSSLADIGDQSLIASWLADTPPLPYSVEEGQHISDLFSDFSVSTHFGRAFTKQVLKSEQTRSADVLHIATHGLFDERLPDIVGLLTSTDSRTFSASDIFFSITEMLNQTYANQLVIISGCETMRGREYSGIGIKSVSQMFLARGAGSAIGTLWKISDQGTAVFMRRFHGHLKDANGDASRALKLARTDMARNRRYSNPYYWAGFVLDSTNQSIDTAVFGGRTATSSISASDGRSSHGCCKSARFSAFEVPTYPFADLAHHALISK